MKDLKAHDNALPDKLRVEIISTYYAPETTGNAPYVSALAARLAENGHRVSVIAAAPHYPDWEVWPHSRWQARERERGVDVRRVMSYVPSRPNFVNRLAYELGFGMQFVKWHERDADVVLLVSPSMFASAMVRLRLALSTKGRRTRTAVWVQDLYSAGVGETQHRLAGLAQSAVLRVEGRLLRSCDVVICIHERFRDYIQTRLAVPPDRVRVIRNWTHVSIPQLGDARLTRIRHGWDDDEIVVLHAGNMGAKQGLESVVHAARLAEERDLPVRFVLLGNGNQKKHLEALASGCLNVTFMDPLPDEEFMAALMAADVLLVNERPGAVAAAVPSKLTTYFATGRPVVAATSSTSTTADELLSSGAGRIVAPGLPDVLLQAVLSTISTWSADSAAGPMYVRETLSEEAAVAAFESLLQEVTGVDGRTKERKGIWQRRH